MLDLISLVLIFILDSLPLMSSKGFFILPYLVYLAYKKEKSSFILVPLLGIILSLHSSNPIFDFVFIAINMVLYYLYFSQFEFNVLNTVMITIIQVIAWELYVGGPIEITNIVILLICYFITNLFYMRRATK